jgi:hypothetical protein
MITLMLTYRAKMSLSQHPVGRLGALFKLSGAKGLSTYCRKMKKWNFFFYASREKMKELTLQLNESTISLNRQSDAVEAAHRRIKSLENSLSWRLTAPLHFVDRTLQRLTHFTHRAAESQTS